MKTIARIQPTEVRNRRLPNYALVAAKSYIFDKSILAKCLPVYGTMLDSTVLAYPKPAVYPAIYAQ